MNYLNLKCQFVGSKIEFHRYESLDTVWMFMPSACIASDRNTFILFLVPSSITVVFVRCTCILFSLLQVSVFPNSLKDYPQ